MPFTGSRKLFEDLFEPPPPPIATKQKGRSSILHTKRNDLLIDRYVFYGLLTQTKYSSILLILQNEFHLSTTTIADVMDDNHLQLVQTKKEYAALEPQKLIKKLCEKWPHMQWDV